ncbi:hypothetical protein [Shewanella sp.]|uniref:hypothetical protein n=1 Tax=Shewanella sp. TaxID=50422 RepID=UPI003F300941
MSTGSLNSNSQSAKKNIRFEHDLIDAIETHKNPLIPFAAWVKQACREKLEREQNAQVTTSKPKAEQVRPVAPSGVQAENERRSLEMQQKIITAIDKLSAAERADVINHRYAKSEFNKAIGGVVSRDSIAKYWDMIEPRLKL